MAKNSEVAVKDDRPAYLKQFEGKGAVRNDDNFDSSDVVIPQIKLLQALSGECETFDNAKPGIFWHTGLDQPVGNDDGSLDFVICSRRKKYLLIAPQEDGQGVLARANDFETWDRTGKWQVKIKGVKQPVTWEITDLNVAKSGLDQWGTYNPDDEDSPPAATMFYDYLVVIPNLMEAGPAVISLTRSAIKKAKKGLNDKISLHAGAGRPLQALVFRASAVEDHNSSNQDFKNWMFTGAGFAPEAIFNKAQELKTLLQDYTVKDEGNVDSADPSSDPDVSGEKRF